MACNASNASVSAAGPGCRMIGDLISWSSPSRTAGMLAQPARAATSSGRNFPRLRRASGAHRIDSVGKPLALALHALPAGNLTFAGGLERSVANLDLTLSLVMADDQAIWRDAGPGQLERMRRRAVGEQLFAAAKHDRHCEDAHSVDQVIGEQRVDEFGTALGDEVRAVFLLRRFTSA